MRKTLPDTLEWGRLVTGPLRSDASSGPFGAFLVRSPSDPDVYLRMIASGVVQEFTWEHVSVSTSRRTPTWEEMCFVKDLFFEEEECVVQFHPPRSQYINNHPYCLHMWRPTLFQIELPPSIMVGIK